jgi:hypothetical protein
LSYTVVVYRDEEVTVEGFSMTVVTGMTTVLVYRMVVLPPSATLLVV